MAGATKAQKTQHYMPPPASRINQAPVGLDRWGRMSSLGAEGARNVTPSAAGKAISPWICGLAAFAAVYLVSGR